MVALTNAANNPPPGSAEAVGGELEALRFSVCVCLFEGMSSDQIAEVDEELNSRRDRVLASTAFCVP